jgi:hypothetical protein
LIILGGPPTIGFGPILRFNEDGTVTVLRRPQSGPGIYHLHSAQFDGVAGPVTIDPRDTHPRYERHAESFGAFARRRTRKLIPVPDWTREDCASALAKQTKSIRKGFDHMVLASNQTLNFAYRVGRKTLDEASFFAELAERSIPIVPELRALLSAYIGQLGEGGEGVQPWEDPDEGIAAFGSALRALALLDPDCLDVLRAYLETRDGEHEGYCLDVVVPAFLERHGWRDAEAVRFGIYATLNRFWGGRKPPEAFQGLRSAMARLVTVEDATETVLREAEHFGRKPDWGYDASAYRAAFCTLLSPADPFEAAVLDGLADDPAEA